MNDGVNNNYRLCQANLEMSYSYQSRNVLFSGFRVCGFTSFIFMNSNLEIPPPGVMGWGRRKRLLHSHHREKAKWDVVYSVPVAERILCLIYGFSRKTDSARFNIKKGLTPISFHTRQWLFNLLLFFAISPTIYGL